jgi:hypothetical protein
MAGSTNPIPRNPAGPPVFFRRRHPGQNRQIKLPGRHLFPNRLEFLMVLMNTTTGAL